MYLRYWYGIVLSHSLATHHSNSVGGKQLLGTHGGDVGDVGKDVNKSHKGDRDEDGTRKVPGGDKTTDV